MEQEGTSAHHPSGLQVACSVHPPLLPPTQLLKLTPRYTPPEAHRSFVERSCRRGGRLNSETRTWSRRRTRQIDAPQAVVRDENIRRLLWC